MKSMKHFMKRKTIKNHRNDGFFKNMKNKKITSLIFVALLALLLYGIESYFTQPSNEPLLLSKEELLEELPTYQGKPYLEINLNEPFFEKEDFSTESFEYYAPLDVLGRCQGAVANLSIDTMPTDKRESIGQIKPSGWQTARYDDLIQDRYLYNRCHLIAFQLSGENANEKNLITGTRYMNVEGMLPFENEVADYIKETGNHVLYRVTPIFQGNELVARGVLMEAYSVEDHGWGIQFNVYVFNVQPGIDIDYMTGVSQRSQ